MTVKYDLNSIKQTELFSYGFVKDLLVLSEDSNARIELLLNNIIVEIPYDQIKKGYYIDFSANIDNLPIRVYIFRDGMKDKYIPYNILNCNRFSEIDLRVYGGVNYYDIMYTEVIPVFGDHNTPVYSY